MITKKRPWKQSTKLHPVLVARFALNLTDQRKKRGWTHEALAARMEITSPYLSLLETMQRTPSLEIVEKFARVFEIDPADLLKEVRA